MANPPQQGPSAAGKRERTATRMRYVAPPGWSMPDPKPGTKTIGRYEIIESLGKGAMGVVYKARDPLLDRTVALKTIMSPRSRGGRVRRAYLERFEREAKAAAKMQHPAIVTIFDVGQHNNIPFMVLEYLPGESLADRLDRVRMPLGKAVSIGLDLASALGFAHKQRIVHRDVKPANVLHAGDARWKLADFGIARMPDSDLTQVGIFMGTPGYAPPEAISRGEYTAQADVFAWGACLYELLSGRIPYEGPDTRTTNGYVIKGQAVSPREHDASIPVPLADVVMRALSSSPGERYKDAHDAEMALRAAWERCLHEDLVSPRALLDTEVPHERVGKLMHATTAAAEARGEPTATRRIHGGQAPDTMRDESDVGFGDDVPTKVVHVGQVDDMVAQAASSAPVRRLVGAGAPRRGAAPVARNPGDPITARAAMAQQRQVAEGADIEAQAKAALARDAEAAARAVLGPEPGRGWLIGAVVVALVLAGLLLVYYLRG